MTPTTELPDELKPCPFCGGKASLIPPMKGSTWEHSWEIHCLNDDCTAACGHDTRLSAVEAWNTRKDKADAEIERLTIERNGYMKAASDYREEIVRLRAAVRWLVISKADIAPDIIADTIRECME